MTGKWTFASVRACMLLKRDGRAKLSVTVRACVWINTGMSKYVCIQRGFATKLFSTNVAGKIGALALRVFLNVGGERVRPCKRLTALDTDVGLLSSVNASMTIEGAGLTECLAAVWALERTLIRVAPPMVD